MADAGEVGHWEILETLNRRAGNRDVSDLVDLGAADPAAAPGDGALHIA
jgi:hypothetical protein